MILGSKHVGAILSSFDVKFYVSALVGVMIKVIHVSVFIAPKWHGCNLKYMNYVLNICEIMSISVGNTSFLGTKEAQFLSVFQYVFCTFLQVFVNLSPFIK